MRCNKIIARQDSAAWSGGDSMPLTQGCILIGFQAAVEKVTLLVLLGFLSTSDLVSFTAVEPLLQV